MANITLKGNTIHTVGELPQVGSAAPKFNLAGTDLSDKGLAQSHGVMVNYRYDPEQVEANHEAFVRDGRIVMSRALQREYDRHLAGRR